MNTVLHESLRTHIEAATLTMAGLKRLERSDETSAILTRLAEKLGVGNIIWSTRESPLHLEIYVHNSANQIMGHFHVAKDGSVDFLPKMSLSSGFNRTF